MIMEGTMQSAGTSQTDRQRDDKSRIIPTRCISTGMLTHSNK